MKRLVRAAVGIICLALTATAGTATAEVVVVVSARSTISALSRNQVTDIFLGKLRHFPDGTPARPLDMAEGSVARDQFYAMFAGRSAAQVKAYWSKIIFTGRGQPPPTVSGAMELKRRVAANTAAIGYIDRSLLDASLREVH
jgi:ABC-type phosphate transport system substrate-binding protein